MNDDKIIHVLAAIEREQADPHPSELGFDMDTWYTQTDCGTTACFAGWSAILEGYRLDNAGLAHKEGESPKFVSWIADDVLELNGDHPFYLPTLDAVYEWAADRMGVDEQVLRDKVQSLAAA